MTRDDSNDILRKICEYFQMDKEELQYCRDKYVREARSIAIYFLHKCCGKTITEVEKIFGIQQPAASIAVRRRKELCVIKNLEKICKV